MLVIAAIGVAAVSSHSSQRHANQKATKSSGEKSYPASLVAVEKTAPSPQYSSNPACYECKPREGFWEQILDPVALFTALAALFTGGNLVVEIRGRRRELRAYVGVVYPEVMIQKRGKERKLVAVIDYE